MVRVGWYRFRTTLGRRWAGYATLIVLVGFVGGIAIAAVAEVRAGRSRRFRVLFRYESVRSHTAHRRVRHHRQRRIQLGKRRAISRTSARQACRRASRS